jgi:hypothetical protein
MEESTRKTVSVTGGRLQTCTSAKYINLTKAGFCQDGNQARIYERATGARAQGGILKKKFENEVWYAGKKGCS